LPKRAQPPHWWRWPRNLGKDDIAGVQVLSGLVAEADRSHQVTRLVRGQFVRELNAFFPNG
jgi:hypothetical protein